MMWNFGSKFPPDIFNRRYAHVVIEVCGLDGQWSRYNGEEHSVSPSLSALPPICDGPSGNTQDSQTVPISMNYADPPVGDQFSASTYRSTTTEDRSQAPQTTPDGLELPTVLSAPQDGTGSRGPIGSDINLLGTHEASSTVGRSHVGLPPSSPGTTEMSLERGLHVLGTSNNNSPAKEGPTIDPGVSLSDRDAQTIPATIPSNTTRPTSHQQTTDLTSSIVHVPSSGDLTDKSVSSSWSVGETDMIRSPEFHFITDLSYEFMASPQLTSFELNWEWAEGPPYFGMQHNEESQSMCSVLKALVNLTGSLFGSLRLCLQFTDTNSSDAMESEKYYSCHQRSPKPMQHSFSPFSR